jgi:hypothetical protein
MGLGVVVEYAGQRRVPQWSALPETPWDYTMFGNDHPVPAPDERIELAFEKIAGGRGAYNRWSINGKSWSSTNPLFTTETIIALRAMRNEEGIRGWLGQARFRPLNKRYSQLDSTILSCGSYAPRSGGARRAARLDIAPEKGPSPRPSRNARLARDMLAA